MSYVGAHRSSGEEHVITNEPDAKRGEQVMRDAMSFFGPHLVSLGVTFIRLDCQGRRTGPELFYGASGFIMSFADEWYYVTAGHIFDDLRKVEVLGASLIAYFGPGRGTPIPIPFNTTWKDHIDDRELGLDIGLVHIRELFRKNLEGFGTRAIGEEQWRHQHRVQFDDYFMIGYPAIYTRGELPPERYGEEMGATIEPVMIPVRRRDAMPKGSEPSALPMFIGELPEQVREFDIKGMSGCPIFGIRKNSDGSVYYWIVAVQSRRSGQDPLAILACPVQVFAPLIEGVVNRVDEGDGSALASEPPVEEPRPD
jgi:hypothetical protein